MYRNSKGNPQRLSFHRLPETLSLKKATLERQFMCQKAVAKNKQAYFFFWPTLYIIMYCIVYYADPAGATEVTQDVIPPTGVPSSLDFVESGSHLRHAATLPPMVTADMITSSTPGTQHSQPNVTFLLPSTLTSQHSDVKPEPEMECGTIDSETTEGVRCRTLRGKSLHEVSKKTA